MGLSVSLFDIFAAEGQIPEGVNSEKLWGSTVKDCVERKASYSDLSHKKCWPLASWNTAVFRCTEILLACHMLTNASLEWPLGVRLKSGSWGLTFTWLINFYFNIFEFLQEHDRSFWWFHYSVKATSNLRNPDPWGINTGVLEPSSLVAYWLGFCAFTAVESLVQSLVGELRSRKLHGAAK